MIKTNLIGAKKIGIVKTALIGWKIKGWKMGMTIDKSTEVLADYIDTYKICGGNGYNPATNITQEACEAFETAIDTMHKYQTMQEVLEKVWNVPACMLDESECLNQIMETYRTVRY